MTKSIELIDSIVRRGLPSHAITPDELHLIDVYWRAANYLSVGQFYFYHDPLLHEPLTLAHVKPLVVGHWDTIPGQNFIYVHLNRVIEAFDVAGPGYGGPALVHLVQDVVDRVPGPGAIISKRRRATSSSSTRTITTNSARTCPISATGRGIKRRERLSQGNLKCSSRKL